MVIFVDADGCPVVDTAIGIANGNNIKIVVVKNYAVKLDDPYVKIITVDISNNSADYYIVNRIESSNILVTQDYGLAAIGLGEGNRTYTLNAKREILKLMRILKRV